MLSIIKNSNNNRLSRLAAIVFLFFASFALTQCKKSSDTNGNTQPPVSGQTSFAVQNDFTDAALSNQHHRAARQSDGRIIAAQSDGGLVRIGSDGKPDASFVKWNFQSGSIISDIVVLTDNKILVSGRLYIANHPYIVRLNADGSLDDAFKAYLTDGVPNALAVRPDGKILVIGTFSYLQSGVLKYHIMRLNADGTLDPGFVCELGFSNYGATCLALASDGKVTIGGVVFSYSKNGLQNRVIVRLNDNGSVDAGFNFTQQIINPAGTPSILAIALDKEGRPLIGGGFYSIGPSQTDYTNYSSIARLTADGTLDKTFASPAAGSDFVNAIQPLDNGNILVGRRLKTVVIDVTDFLTVVDSKGVASDFRLGFKQGGIDDIVPESATSFILVGAFRPAAGGQYGLVRLVQK